MFALEVRDQIMIAHSLEGAFFGPAQNLHGATFVVDATFFAEELTAHGVVVDIGRAIETLKEILATVNYRNLDDLPEFRGQRTTTEFMCKWVFDQLVDAAKGGRLGEGGDAIARLRVTLTETPVAKAWYEAAL